MKPWIRIRDPDADFLPSRIPDPGVKKAPNPGSRNPDPDPQHCLQFDADPEPDPRFIPVLSNAPKRPSKSSIFSLWCGFGSCFSLWCGSGSSFPLWFGSGSCFPKSGFATLVWPLSVSLKVTKPQCNIHSKCNWKSKIDLHHILGTRDTTTDTKPAFA